jgi:type I restriction enzyme R subunit
VDVISMVKHAAKEQSRCSLPSSGSSAHSKVTAGQSFTAEQQKWLDRIREHMLQNLSIDREDFEYQDALSAAGGWGAARSSSATMTLNNLLHRLNEAIAA